MLGNRDDIEIDGHKVLLGLNFYGNYHKDLGEGGPIIGHEYMDLLDRERPTDGSQLDLELATRLFATPKAIDQRDRHAAFVFRIGAEWLALPMQVVDEVADLRDIHSLPHRRSGVVLGLANVRGELLVCVSMNRLLGIDPAAEAGSRTQRIVHRRLLVIRNEGSRFAFPVDEVHGTQRYDARQLKPVPTTVGKSAASYSQAVLSWQGHTVGLLDDGLLFHSLGRNLA